MVTTVLKGTNDENESNSNVEKYGYFSIYTQNCF